MKKIVICPQCGADCEYDDTTKWEGNREHEEYNCPDCGCLLGTAFTDGIPVVRVIHHGSETASDTESN